MSFDPKPGRGRAFLKILVVLATVAGITALVTSAFQLGITAGLITAGEMLAVYAVPAMIFDWPRLTLDDVLGCIGAIVSAIGAFILPCSAGEPDHHRSPRVSTVTTRDLSRVIGTATLLSASLIALFALVCLDLSLLSAVVGCYNPTSNAVECSAASSALALSMSLTFVTTGFGWLSLKAGRRLAQRLW